VRWRWIILAALVVVLVPIAIVVVPILTHGNQGTAGQVPATEEWPLSVTAHGADGRDRSFSVESGDEGVALDTSALVPGQQLIVRGEGFDGSRDWAWKLFGARSYDSVEEGTFTAYLVVGEPADAKLDCTVDACGIFTRNDHTALSDRVQDLYVPVGFAR
jgi:hypothetical protein